MRSNWSWNMILLFHVSELNFWLYSMLFVVVVIVEKFDTSWRCGMKYQIWLNIYIRSFLLIINPCCFFYSEAFSLSLLCFHSKCICFCFVSFCLVAKILENFYGNNALWNNFPFYLPIVLWLFAYTFFLFLLLVIFLLFLEHHFNVNHSKLCELFRWALIHKLFTCMKYLGKFVGRVKGTKINYNIDRHI